jgi:DNA-directed RNA polymerase specialized sigma subunit
MDLETKFAVEDGMAFLDNVSSEEISKENESQLDRVRSVLDQLPDREADFIDLYYFKRIKQTDIAAMFGVSQPTVCYRLQRAAARIHYLLKMPEVTLDELQEACVAIKLSEIDMQIMLLMYQTTCQSEVAKKLVVSQGFVRHRFIRAVNKFKKADPESKYVKIFELVSDNLNILREVQRPHLDSKFYVVL